MRIHTSATFQDVVRAAQIARVDLVVCSEHGSRSAERAFEVKLEGASRRRPNGGSSGAGSGYAADWDQWGVFLNYLFNIDPNTHCWAYKDSGDFDNKTESRFFKIGFPDDYHGDHRFEYDYPYTQKCSRCSAVRRWN